MSSPLLRTIEQIGHEKGIDVEIIIKAVEEAMTTASKKYFRTNENIYSVFNRETGTIEVFAKKKVVDKVENPEEEISLDEAQKIDSKTAVGKEISIKKSTEGLGRIAAQTAKQVIFQKVLEAERDNIYQKYKEKVGEIINGMVKRFDKGDIIIDIGETEAILPRKEQSKAESYSIGDRIRAVIIDANRSARSPQVVVSRTDAQLLIKLLQMEVPEIYDNTVTVKNAVREAGERAKVAVYSNQPDVDPVGACVGIKGNRIQSVIRELRREKIDIVEYSNDAIVYATNALSPAKISKISIVDSKEKLMEVIVEDNQLSLAIGKKGQNVRLASKLIEWKIDIKSESEKKEEIKNKMEMISKADSMLEQLPGIGEKTAKKLIESGYYSLKKISEASIEQLSSIPSIGTKLAETLINEAKKIVTKNTGA
jgi:N utilization substance protein A